MDCEECRARFDTFEFESEERKKVLEHLEKCKECKKFYREMDLSLKLFKSSELGIPIPESREDFAERILDAIDGGFAPGVFSKVLQITTIAFGFLLFFILGILISSKNESTKNFSPELKLSGKQVQAKISKDSFWLNVRGKDMKKSVDLKIESSK